ncbi:hypothetical protein [Turicimonas muris]|uniref:hypothetical protein n=1 Tax=Turicimonas muris TaxID=1796652 RepID=UPI00248CD318|nr:hypothetical protein [Turicimonas muris]
MKFKRKLKKEFIDALENFIDSDETLDALEKKQILNYSVSQFELAANGDLAKSDCSMSLAASPGADFINELYYVLVIPKVTPPIGAEMSHNFELVTVED